MKLYEKLPGPPRRRAGGKKSKRGASPDEAPALAPGVTTLDRVHIAMLLQAAGKSNALRTMLKVESERGQDFPVAWPTRSPPSIHATARKNAW